MFCGRMEDTFYGWFTVHIVQLRVLSYKETDKFGSLGESRVRDYVSSKWYNSPFLGNTTAVTEKMIFNPKKGRAEGARRTYFF
jgi:hypothetical protein